MKTASSCNWTSDHSNCVSIHRLSNKKAYTERVDCSPVYILLSEIVNKFITLSILAAMISSTNTQKLILKNCLNICCRNASENWITYVFFKKRFK